MSNGSIITGPPTCHLGGLSSQKRAVRHEEKQGGLQQGEVPDVREFGEEGREAAHGRAQREWAQENAQEVSQGLENSHAIKSTCWVIIVFYGSGMEMLRVYVYNRLSVRDFKCEIWGNSGLKLE